MKEWRSLLGKVPRWGSSEALRRAYVTILGIACLSHMAISHRAAGQLLPQNVANGATNRGCVSVIVSNVSEGRNSRFEMKTVRDAGAQEELTFAESEKTDVQFSKVEARRKRSLWVQIVGGFGLLFWVQRFRNWSI
jgi:hypothetical protein